MKRTRLGWHYEGVGRLGKDQKESVSLRPE